MKKFSENRKARFDYQISETFEAGVVLTGLEVKAIRASKVNLNGSYGRILLTNTKPEIWIVGMHVGILEGDTSRSRKLLIKRAEIDHLIGKLHEKGLTLVPLSIYPKQGFIKIEFGLGKGMKKYDKREKIKEKETKREMLRNKLR